MDFKKIAGYGVLGLGVLWLIQGSTNSSSGVDTGASGGLLVGGGGLPASPTDSGFIITPPATTNYNFMAPQPSEGFFIGASAPADPSTPTSKKTTTSGGGGGTPVYNPATKTYTFFEGTPENVKQQIITTTERQISSAPANNPFIVDSVKKQTVPTPTPTPTYNWAQKTAGQAYTGWSRITNKVRGWF